MHIDLVLCFLLTLTVIPNLYNDMQRYSVAYLSVILAQVILTSGLSQHDPGC